MPAAALRPFRTRVLLPALLGVTIGVILPAGAQEEEQAPPPPPPTLPESTSAARTPRAGDEVVVIMKDSSRLTGRLVTRSNEVTVLNIAGVDLRVPTEDIDRVVVQRPLLERYREMRALIGDADVPRLMLLAQWLESNGLLDEAAAELDHVLGVEPTNTEAARLRQTIARQTELRERAKSGSPREPGAPAPEEEEDPESEREPLPPASRVAGFPLLSPEQINLMKVYELDLGSPPRLTIDRATIEKLIQSYADSPLIPSTRDARERFFALPAVEILNLMFRLQARELYGEVRVQGNPESMRQFRDNVHRSWLVNACATPGCHGAGSGPVHRQPGSNLVLFNRKSTHEQSFYTNFLILDRYRLADGTPLLDYENPERSALLQMALPRSESIRPHPDVHGWTPAFRTTDDRRFRQAVEWLRSLYRPRPTYPIEYPPPEATPPPPAAGANPER